MLGQALPEGAWQHVAQLRGDCGRVHFDEIDGGVAGDESLMACVGVDALQQAPVAPARYFAELAAGVVCGVLAIAHLKELPNLDGAGVGPGHGALAFGGVKGFACQETAPCVPDGGIGVRGFELEWVAGLGRLMGSPVIEQLQGIHR